MINSDRNISETNPDSFLPLVREYESVIETLTTQVEFYANEQENLRKEISSLILENKVLGESVKELVDTQSHRDTEDEEKKTDKELIENLKKQLNLTLNEKETVVELWQTALKNIDHLEEELRVFEGRTHGYFSKKEVIKLKQKYENAINDLETQLHECQSKLKNITHESETILQNKNFDLRQALEIQENNTASVKRLESEVKHLQGKLKDISIIKDKLETKLHVKSVLIDELKTKNIEAKAKVTEAIQIVEAAFHEKDAALLREKETKEEIVNISKALSEVMDDAAEKIKKDNENVKQECNIKLSTLQQNIQTLKKELNTKNIQLEKTTKECKLLEEELSRLRKGNISFDENNTTKLLILENKLESTFQKLLLSEKNNLQVKAEKENLKSDLQQMANWYENDVKSREIEKQALKHKAQVLQKQLQISNRSLIQVAKDMEKMNTKIKFLDADIQEKLQAKDMVCEQTLTRALEEVQNKNTSVQNKFEKYFEKQTILNKKYRKEVQDIMDKLEFRINDLKQINKKLEKKLKGSVDESVYYKKSLTEICTKLIKNDKT